jgi:hypothetical protein
MYIPTTYVSTGMLRLKKKMEIRNVVTVQIRKKKPKQNVSDRRNIKTLLSNYMMSCKAMDKSHHAALKMKFKKEDVMIFNLYPELSFPICVVL